MNRLSLTAFLLLSIAPAAFADEVLMTGGSRIVGQVVRLGDGELIVKTGFAGELTIDATKVQGITTAEPLNVELDSGERVIGTLKFVPGTGQRIASNTLGDRDIEAGRLAAMWGPDEDGPYVAAIKKDLEAARPKWSLEAAVGLDGQTGNSERVGVNGGVEIRRETEKDRTLLYAKARYAKEDGQDSAKEFIGGANMEVDLTERWFAWGNLEFEHDKFENLDLRSTATAGLGHFVIREEDHELKLRGGAGFQHEAFSDGTNEGEAVAEAGLDYRKDFGEWLSFVHHTTYYPTFADAQDFRLEIENALEMPLNGSEIWKLRAGVRNQYDNMPKSGVEELDTFYFLHLVAEIE